MSFVAHPHCIFLQAADYLSIRATSSSDKDLDTSTFEAGQLESNNAACSARVGSDLGDSSDSWHSLQPPSVAEEFRRPWSLYSSLGFQSHKPNVSRLDSHVNDWKSASSADQRARLSHLMSSFRLLPEKPEQPKKDFVAAASANSGNDHGRRRVWCEFVGDDGVREVGLVEVVHAPIKTVARMREKLGKCPPKKFNTYRR